MVTNATMTVIPRTAGVQTLRLAMAAGSALLRNARVLVSGASIAGPALALWLSRYGFQVTVVEKAAEVRRGGLAVDFKGATHMTVLRRMGILDDVEAARVRAWRTSGCRVFCPHMHFCSRQLRTQTSASSFWVRSGQAHGVHQKSGASPKPWSVHHGWTCGNPPTLRWFSEAMTTLNFVSQAPSAGDGVIVDAAGRRIATMPAEFSGGDVEIARGDLAQILYDRTAAKCEYLFGDSIASLNETADGVDVGFERAAPRAFDLVRSY